MLRLVITEFTKARTTRTVLGLLAGTIFLTIVGVAAAISTAETRGLALASSEGVQTVLHASASGAIFVMAFGIIGMAGEFRQGTITDTFLTTPDRRKVLVAKLIAYTAIGLLAGLISTLTAMAVAVPWLDAKGAPVSFSDGNLWLSALGAMLWASLYGMLGVSFGALTRNILTGLLVAFGWLLVAEQMISGALGAIDLGDVADYLPGAAARALGRAPEAGLLPMWAGGALLVTYAIMFAIVAERFTMRRDVT
ncbi:MAG: ABC transporter permease [Thermoleophilia bacterium]